MDIILRNIEKHFGDKVVFQQFSHTFPEKCWTMVTGPSGCGKTTLFRILLGLEKIDKGEIINLPGKCSAVFQENRLCEELSVRDNIWLATDSRSFSENSVVKALERIGLSACKDQKVSELSGGMKRRVAIARAVLATEDICLLDEPFYGLDEKNKEAVMQFLIDSLREKTVILITHDKDAEAYLKRRNVIAHELRM